MNASWQEDYFKALIRLRLLLPVNPKQAPKNAIGAILWLDENLAGLLLIEPRCLGKEERTDEVIGALTMDLIRPTFNPIAAFLRSSIAARSVRWDQAAFDDHRPALWGELRSGLAQARRRTRFHSRSSAGQNQQNPHRRLTVSRPTRRIRGPRLTAVNLCRLFGRTEPRAAEQDRPSKDWLWN